MLAKVTNPRKPASACSGAKLSPAFAVNGSPAFELKLLIPEATAQGVERWAEAHLSRDAHCDPGLACRYEVSTLYLDTPRFDVFHDAIELQGAKLRLRRYGDGSQVFLERKRRRADRVQKWRTPVEAQDLWRLSGESTGEDWPGGWFQDAVTAWAFRPTCLLTYLRTAFFHPSDDAHLRLTLDRSIRCAAATGWSVPAVRKSGASSISDDAVVCELKFQETMPPAFKQLVAELGLTPGRFSKYRQACRALHLMKAEEPSDA